uniref:TAPON1-like protein n=1 Tax=Hypocrea atroviridis TaxID=63577 RepID=A0A4D6GQM1_HYPAT|nr:TAPON1-like protein [Trichoderma atroviride]
MAARASITAVLLAVLLGYAYNSYVQRALVVMGAFRQPGSTELAPGDFVVIEGTTHCEDLHHHESTGLIFTACEGFKGARLKWFPPIDHFFEPSHPELVKGNLQVIDPKTLKAQVLELEGFSGPFVTHGIDVIDDPKKPKGEAVYIFAVNHRPNPKHYGENGDAKAPQCYSVIELFHHVVGSGKARHVRTIWHPLITTPNDIFAMSPTSFLVTNDHYFRTGLPRMLEDVLSLIARTNTVHVQLQDLKPVKSDDAGVHASVALDKLHNLNGLGHGRTEDEVFVTGCSSGVIHVGKISEGKDAEKIISVSKTIEFSSPVDNPTYFKDPYANKTFDASGVVASGPTRAVDWFSNKALEDVLDPSMVWMASPRSGGQKGEGAAKGEEDWDLKLIFQDDGQRVRTSSASVLLAIDPKEEQGRRRAWLFVSSYQAKNAIAVKIDL